MTEHEGNYVPKKRAPFISMPERESESLLSIVVTVKNEKHPIGFAAWPEKKTEWEKA